jgi:hypothetical protein
MSDSSAIWRLMSYFASNWNNFISMTMIMLMFDPNLYNCKAEYDGQYHFSYPLVNQDIHP